mgnify:CR=1 FL=1
MEGSIIFYTYGSTLELNGQQFEAGRLTEDLLNLSPDDYHPLHERMVRIRTLMDIYEYVRKSELWWKLNDEMEQLCQELRRNIMDKDTKGRPRNGLLTTNKG